MAARITKSLDTLRSQVNALAPKRSKASDGWLGDAKHSMRKSDHNPEPDGTVDAFDLTHDPFNGVDIQKVCDAIIASKDRRVSYLICNGKIIAGNGGPKPWVKRAYTGPNKHTKHLHVSVLDAFQDDTAKWQIDDAFGVVAGPAPRPKPRPASKPAIYTDKGTVALAQSQLWALGYTEVGSRDPKTGAFDGKIGKMTRTAILAFRNENDLPLADVIDDELLAALRSAKPRVLPEARADAAPAAVRAAVPEVKSNFFAQIGAFILCIPAMIGAAISGLMDNIGLSKETLEPIKEFFSDVPPIMWFLLVGGVALGIYLVTRNGIKQGNEAYQAGARR
jgi:hypothetical protein